MGNTMRWSWKVGALAGTDIRIHATFLLLLGWLLMNDWMAGHSIDAVIDGMVLIAALFSCVLLHEFGHVFAASRFGIRTYDVTLFPIGGLARLERIPEEPKKEFWIAIAGPAVNMAIVAILSVWLFATNDWEPIRRLSIGSGSLLERMLFANLTLALFNLIPAFPLDGGRIFRAILAAHTNYSKATTVAATIGRCVAVALMVWGIFANPMLLLIGLFVWIGAGQEAYAARFRAALSGVRVRAAMATDFQRLQGRDTLAEAVRLILAGSRHDLPVVEHGRVIGILTRSQLLIGLAENGHDFPVAKAMDREFMTAHPSDMLNDISTELQKRACHTVPVVSNGRLEGLLTMENIGEYFLIDTALQERSPGSGLLKGGLKGFWNSQGSNPMLVIPPDKPLK